MFEWKTPVISTLFANTCPNLQSYVESTTVSARFGKGGCCRYLPRTILNPFDYGIMEKAETFFHSAEFGWNDVGTWDALTSNGTDQDGNVIRGRSSRVTVITASFTAEAAYKRPWRSESDYRRHGGRTACLDRTNAGSEECRRRMKNRQRRISYRSVKLSMKGKIICVKTSIPYCRIEYICNFNI
jgi:hypothetical protein